MQYAIVVTPRLEALMAKLGKDAAEARAGALQDVISTIEAQAVKAEARHAITSNLVNSITSFIAKGVGWIKAAVKYASFVHDGTKPHVIRAKGKQALYWPGAAHPVKSVQHPGFKGRPFFDIAMGRAKVEATYDRSLQNFLTRRGW